MAEHVTSEESELYALGVLDGEEKNVFETHLLSCDDCTRGVASAHQRVALIGLACVPETPRPAVREKIMRRIRAERAGSWTQEKNAQISELRVEREPEPEPEPVAKKAKPKPEPIIEPEPELEALAAEAAEQPQRRVAWLAAALAVVVLAASAAGFWMLRRSHQNPVAQVHQQQTEGSQPSAAPEAAPSTESAKALPEQKPKAMTEANRAAAASDAVAQQPASDSDAQPETLALNSPTRISESASRSDAAPPPALAIGADLDAGHGTALPVLPGSAPEPRVQPASASGPLRISSGVAAARLIVPIQPVYPDLARQARVQGTVVVDATIATTGRVRYVHVVSGPALLTGAALSAVQRARYRPFMLNGAPVEAETTITVVFSLTG